MEIKDRLRSLREEKGLTLDMLVYDLNNKFDVDISKGLVSKWFYPGHILKICAALTCIIGMLQIPILITIRNIKTIDLLED